jgi:hypothetical protein
MGSWSNRRLAIPLSAIAFFAVAFTAPAAGTLLVMPPTTVFVVETLGIAAIVLLMSGAIPFSRAPRSLVRVPPSGHRERASPRIIMEAGISKRPPEQPKRSAADDALDLVRMDDDGGSASPS